jgi:hypothetical protein
MGFRFDQNRHRSRGTLGSPEKIIDLKSFGRELVVRFELPYIH